MESFSSYLSLVAAANPAIPSRDPEWLFYPGMLFGSRAKWWADFGTRLTDHEGLDICWFRTGTGPVRGLPPGTRVPAASPGAVLAVCDDFLGKSVLVQSREDTGSGFRLLTLYSHVVPDPGLLPGDPVPKGRIIAGTADTRGRRSGIPSHLHLSVMEISREVKPGDLNWDTFVHAGPLVVRWYDPVRCLPQASGAGATHGLPSRRP